MTEAVHKWLKQRLAAKLQPVPVAPTRSQPFAPGLGGLTGLLCPAARKRAKAAGK